MGQYQSDYLFSLDQSRLYQDYYSLPEYLEELQ